MAGLGTDALRCSEILGARLTIIANPYRLFRQYHARLCGLYSRRLHRQSVGHCLVLLDYATLLFPYSAIRRSSGGCCSSTSRASPHRRLRLALRLQWRAAFLLIDARSLISSGLVLGDSVDF